MLIRGYNSKARVVGGYIDDHPKYYWMFGDKSDHAVGDRFPAFQVFQIRQLSFCVIPIA